MLHTDDEFLRAIEADPREGTLRFAYADWLTEHDDPRGELIRVEEEMRALPAFADRFWELKPRRNQLRLEAGSEWCAKMRYGTECLPVFAHGIPGGWRERWRLIREFTERWHQVPMPDVGGRQAEIAAAEQQVGRPLPPSVREWVGYAWDTQRDGRPLAFLDDSLDVAPVPGQLAISLGSDSQGNLWGVKFSDMQCPDPPVDRCIWPDYEPADDETHAASVATFAFRDLLLSDRGARHLAHFADARDQNHILGEMRAHFPVLARWDDFDISEMDNVLVALWDRGRSRGRTLYAWVASHADEESLPAFIRKLIPRSDGPIPF